MTKIGIIGLGLIGGSLAKALRSKVKSIQIIAFNRTEPALQNALSDGVIDGYSLEIDNNFNGCDVLFICTPVSKIYFYVNKLVPIVGRDCIITDVGSTKANIYQEMEKLGNTVCFIGGHPMAGSEKTGYNAAREYLFENAYYILTPAPNVSNEKLVLLIDLINKIGALPITVSPSHHDFIVSAISHVPHIIASTLVNMVKSFENHDGGYMKLLAAGGFKDITRIASSSPVMWSNICIDNETEILKTLNAFKASLNEFETALKSKNENNIHNYFSVAKNYRDDFKNTGGYNKIYDVYVDVCDKPGIIATVATLLSVNDINIKNIGIINNREYANGILQIILEEEKSKNKTIEILRDMNFIVHTHE